MKKWRQTTAFLFVVFGFVNGWQRGKYATNSFFFFNTSQIRYHFWSELKRQNTCHTLEHFLLVWFRISWQNGERKENNHSLNVNLWSRYFHRTVASETAVQSYLFPLKKKPFCPKHIQVSMQNLMSHDSPVQLSEVELLSPWGEYPNTLEKSCSYWSEFLWFCFWPVELLA